MAHGLFAAATGTARVTVATFDPRLSIYDSAEALERWLLYNYGTEDDMKARVASEKQRMHIESLAALKRMNAQARSKCLDCGLLLAVDCNKKRCMTCEARHRAWINGQHNERRRDKRAKERTRPGWSKPGMGWRKSYKDPLPKWMEANEPE